MAQLYAEYLQWRCAEGLQTGPVFGYETRKSLEAVPDSPFILCCRPAKVLALVPPLTAIGRVAQAQRALTLLNAALPVSARTATTPAPAEWVSAVALATALRDALPTAAPDVTHAAGDSHTFDGNAGARRVRSNDAEW